MSSSPSASYDIQVHKCQCAVHHLSSEPNAVSAYDLLMALMWNALRSAELLDVKAHITITCLPCQRFPGFMTEALIDLSCTARLQEGFGHPCENIRTSRSSAVSSKAWRVRSSLPVIDTATEPSVEGETKLHFMPMTSSKQMACSNPLAQRPSHELCAMPRFVGHALLFRTTASWDTSHQRAEKQCRDGFACRQHPTSTGQCDVTEKRASASCITSLSQEVKQ